MVADYVIVGAGSAGCLLANRLSANPKNTVLLIEAGSKDENIKIKIPAAFHKLFYSKYDWAFETVPQKEMHDRRMFQPRGKGLGGSSSINAMIYIRGHRADYDGWAELGNQGWSYEEVLPYFKKFERNTIFDDKHHGTKGELVVDNLRYPNPLSHQLLLAAQQAGYTINPDFNGPKQRGFGFYQVTQTEGKRCSAADAFLKSVLHRKNLHVLTHALVEKITVDEQSATGVVVRRNGEQIRVTANREVVLCAGAFGSPHLLLLSGIGEAAALRQKGINVVQNLPGVGKNLQDHLICGQVYSCHQPITLDRAEQFPQVLRHYWQYLLSKKGPFVSNIAECGGFMNMREAAQPPDLQFHFAPCYFIRHGFLNPKQGYGFSLGATFIQPQSTGELRLKSAHSQDSLLIDPRYFSAEQDREDAILGYQLTQKILAQAAFANYRKKLYLPERELETPDEILDMMRSYSETLYHPVGTCKMGDDAMSVVNSQLQVHGLQRLRVVDASIMPRIVRGNTNAPTMMIAEKGAELILKAQNTSTSTPAMESR